MRNPLPVWMSGLLLATTFTGAVAQTTQATPTYGPELQGFNYPYELKHYAFDSQGVHLHMGYMDVAAVGKPNGRTAVLMHGKNFCGATWDQTIKTLSEAGYRVIAPDQIGFCTSTKPEHYQYSF